MGPENATNCTVGKWVPDELQSSRRVPRRSNLRLSFRFPIGSTNFFSIFHFPVGSLAADQRLISPPVDDACGSEWRRGVPPAQATTDGLNQGRHGISNRAMETV